MNGLAFAGLLLAHAAIHAAYIAPRPPVTAGGPEWPFELTASWLLGPLGVDAGSARLIGLALVAVTIVGFATAAVASLGLLPGSLWSPAIAVAAIASLTLLLLYFHPWLVLGVAIDVVLLWAVLVATWRPAGLAT